MRRTCHAARITKEQPRMSTFFPADEITGLYSQEPFHRAILDTLPMAVGVFELVSPTVFHVAFMNRIAREADYADTKDIIGKRLDEIMPTATVAQVIQRFQDCMECGTAQTIEDSYQLPNGLLWTTSTFAPMRDADGRITHVLCTWRDITAEKQRALAEQQHKEEIIEQQTIALA